MIEMTGPQWLQIIVIVGVVIHVLIVSILAKKRNIAGKCARCGVDLGFDGSNIALDNETKVTVCSKCARTTKQNQKIAYYFFVAITGMMAFILIALVVFMVTEKDFKFDRSDFGFIVGMLGISIWSYVMTRNIKKAFKTKSTKIKLIIAEPRSAVLSIWRDTFQDVPTVKVLDAPPSSLCEVKGIDAEMMSASIAHRRFGGCLEEDTTLILNEDDPSAPKWIIAVPPVSTGEWTVADDGKLAWAENRSEPGEEAVRRIFIEAFAAIDKFNASNTFKIRTIGFGAETVCFRCDLSSYASVIKKVYLNWFR